VASGLQHGFDWSPIYSKGRDMVQIPFDLSSDNSEVLKSISEVLNRIKTVEETNRRIRREEDEARRARRAEEDQTRRNRREEEAWQRRSGEMETGRLNIMQRVSRSTNRLITEVANVSNAWQLVTESMARAHAEGERIREVTRAIDQSLRGMRELGDSQSIAGDRRSVMQAASAIGVVPEQIVQSRELVREAPAESRAALATRLAEIGQFAGDDARSRLAPLASALVSRRGVDDSLDAAMVLQRLTPRDRRLGGEQLQQLAGLGVDSERALAMQSQFSPGALSSIIQLSESDLRGRNADRNVGSLVSLAPAARLERLLTDPTLARRALGPQVAGEVAAGIQGTRFIQNEIGIATRGDEARNTVRRLRENDPVGVAESQAATRRRLAELNRGFEHRLAGIAAEQIEALGIERGAAPTQRLAAANEFGFWRALGFSPESSLRSQGIAGAIGDENINILREMLEALRRQEAAQQRQIEAALQANNARRAPSIVADPEAGR